MNLKLKRTPGIYLVGFMACGKSTVGRMYAEEIGWDFADLDEDIESWQQTTISDLFARLGEPEFRRIETEAITRRIHSVRNGWPTVLALGGGAFAREDNIQLLNEHGITVWLDTPLNIIKERVGQSCHRPLARDPERFERLYTQRLEFYERAAYRLTIPDGSSRTALRALVDLRLLD
jgi:shikimate kinase